MSGEQLGGIGLGLLACVVGVGGIVAALRRRSRRADIAATYGSTGGIAYTVAQAGCSALMILGGIALVAIALVIRR